MELDSEVLSAVLVNCALCPSIVTSSQEALTFPHLREMIVIRETFVIIFMTEIGQKEAEEFFFRPLPVQCGPGFCARALLAVEIGQDGAVKCSQIAGGNHSAQLRGRQ